MASYFSSLVSGIGNRIYSLLPQNEHTRQTAKLESHLSNLQTALNDKTSAAFNKALIKTSAQLKSEKAKCEQQLQRLNGSFFQDPKSSLKKAWDTLTNEVFNALGTSIQNRSELEPISLELQDTNFIKAKSAIQIYKALEKKRDSAEETIRNILSTEKTNSAITDIDHSLAEQEETLLARQNALCGNYYQDPGSLLDQKWKEYQTAVIASDSNADSLLQEYTALEEERKSLDAKINLLKEQRSIPAAAAERNIETLTLSSIQEQIQALNETKATEASLAGVDWKKTASAAASLALTSAGYILSQTLVG